MPYGYRRKSMRKKSTKLNPVGRTPAARGLPYVKKARKPRKSKAASNQDALAKVVRVVSRMQKKQYGNLQLQKHIYVNKTDGPVHPANSTANQRLCAEQPIIWMLQNISTNANVYQLINDNSVTPQTYITSPCGRWEQQVFSPSVLGDPAQMDHFNTQLDWGNSDGGTSGPHVSAKFMLGTSVYNINLTTLGLSGTIQLVLVAPRAINFSGSRAVNNQLPESLVSFVQTAPLSELQNIVSSRYYKTKVLRTHYFSNFQVQGLPPGAPATEHAKASLYQTYCQKNWRVKINHNSTIEVATVSAANQIYDYEKIPLNKQSFLMIRTSVSKKELQAQFASGPAVAGLDPYQRISCEMQRLASFRDELGSST